MIGGITSGKQELMGKNGNAATCLSCPKEVRDELWAIDRNKRQNRVKQTEGWCKIKVKKMDLGYLEGTIDLFKHSKATAPKKPKGEIEAQI